MGPQHCCRVGDAHKSTSPGCYELLTEGPVPCLLETNENFAIHMKS